jgi:hypothetical protein
LLVNVSHRHRPSPPQSTAPALSTAVDCSIVTVSLPAIDIWHNQKKTRAVVQTAIGVSTTARGNRVLLVVLDADAARGGGNVLSAENGRLISFTARMLGVAACHRACENASEL